MKQFYAALKCQGQTAQRMVILFLSLLLGTGAFATDYFSRQTGGWNAPATWSLTRGGAAAATFPVAGDNVYILNGHTVTVNVASAAATVTVETGGILTSGTFGLTLTGDLINNGTFSASTGLLNLAGQFVNAGTFTEGTGTINFNGSANQSIPALTYNNLQASTGGTKFLMGNTTVKTVLTVNAGTALDLGANTLTLSGNGTPLVVNGSFLAGTSTVAFSQNAAQNVPGLTYYNLQTAGTGTKALAGATTVNNLISLTAGTLALGANTLTLNGTGTPISGTGITFGTSTVNFNAAGNQNIPAFTYNNLQTSNTGTKTLVGNTTVSSALTVNSSSIFNLGANTLTLSGGGNPLVVNGSFLAGTSTVNFSPDAAQNVPGVIYNNLQISGGNTKTLTGSATVQNLLTFTAGTFSLGSNTLTLSGSGNPIIGSGLSIGSSTIVYNGSSAQTIGTMPTLNNLTINNPAGVTLGAASTTVNGTLNFISGKVTTPGANVLILGNAASVTGAAADKYVIGNLRWTTLASSAPKFFPIGDATKYAPVQIDFVANTAGQVTTYSTAGDHPQVAISEINPLKSVNRVWYMSGTGVTNYNATFNFDAADVDAGANTANFGVNSYVSGTNSWLVHNIGTRTASSTQAVGLTSFANPFQVGEVAAETPCGFNSNTNSGVNVSFCIDVLATTPIVTNTLSAGQYLTVDVIAGLKYRIYTANTTNPAEPLMISIYDQNAPAAPALATSFSNTGNPIPNAPNNVYIDYTSTISGKIRVLINKKRDCASTTPGNLSVRVQLYGGSNTLDDQMAAGTDSWVAHIYDGVTNVPFTGAFSDYLGYYPEPETFSEIFGNNTADNCISTIYSGGNLNGTTIRTDRFSVRHRMNSTKKGLYIADIKSDDGTRLAVDGTLVYNYHPSNWAQGQSPTLRPRILMNLNGTSSLQLDYNEITGGQEVSFTNFVKVIGNNLSTGLNQANCQGNDAVPISGDTLALPLPAGLFREGNTTGYKWYYSLTPGGARVLLPNDSLHSFTPNTSVAPFNVPGLYYIYRQVTLRSTNNLNATASPYVQTIESNPAILTVTVSAPLQTVTTANASFCYGGGATVNLASSTLGVNYQLRNNSNNAAVGGIIAGTNGPLNFSTGPLYATTTFNVTAINTTNGCTVKMTNLVTFSTTPDGGKSVSADYGLVCVGNSAKVKVSNADLGVRYLLRNDADNTPVSDTLTGDGGDLELEIPVGYLVDTVTTFHVWALDIASGCSGKLLDTVQIATLSLSSPVFDIDQDFCSLDSGRVLLTPTNLGYASYLWSNDSTTASIIIEQSGIYTVTVTDNNGCRTTKSINVGDELLINGDFSLGRDVGYVTDYVWAPLNPQNAPQYTINVNARNTHTNFWGRDHTSKTGNFMIVNGEGPGRRIWQTTVKVEPNTRYYFSAWAMSLNNAAPFGRMVFNIEGQNVGDTADLPAGVENNSNYGWRRFYGAWDSGPRDASNENVIIKINNLVGGNAGNDFGLDDISFSKLSPVRFFGASIGNGGNNLCLNDTLKLTANLTGGQNPITYSWRGPGGFTSTLPNPIITNAQGGWYYLDAKEGRNCQSKDSVFIILSDPSVGSVSQGVYRCQTGISMYVSGMVPNSRNNTIYYTISGITGTRVATGIDVDAAGVGAFYIAAPPTSWDNRTLTIITVDNGSCSKTVSGVSTTLAVKPNNNTWVGGPTGNWVDPWNWCPGVPQQGTNITIPTGTTIYINNNDSARVNDILLQGNAQVKINNGGRLMFWGNFTAGSTGKIDATEGVVETKRDNNNQNLIATNFVDRKISTLLVGNTNTNGKTTITGDSLFITSALLFGNIAGDLETNNLLVLASSDTATARVGVITGTQNVITGDFIVERYLMNAAKWRLLSPNTLRAGQTVRNSWQENGVNYPGYGFIAADTRYTPANTLGFDLRGANSSVKRFDANAEDWVAVDNTDVLPLTTERGYFVFVQGDRGTNFPNTKATRLRSVGAINRGTQSPIPVPANKFAVIGNPYPSRIDLRLVNKSNISPSIYVWDPSLGGSYNLGGYNTLLFDGINYVNLLPSAVYGPAFSINNFIESGLAFFVKATASNGSVTFEENDKVAGSEVANFNPMQSQRLHALLNLAPAANKPAIVLDGVMAQFGEGYNNGVDDEDIRKIATVAENVTWKIGNTSIVAERRSTPLANDTLHLTVSKMRVQNYQWELSLDNMDMPGMSAYLWDKFLAKLTPINLTGSTTINFSVQNVAGSYAEDRFKIVFKPAAVLPVTITTITAQRKADATVQVQWKSEQEWSLQTYEVERSVDGSNFSSVASNSPANNAGASASYSILDTRAPGTDLFYRIKAISLDGLVQYSSVVKVAGTKTAASVSVQPNPVVGKRMNVVFTGMQTGSLRLMLVNASGQVVHTSMLNVTTNRFTETIQLSSAVAAGRYQLVLIGANGYKTNQQVVLQ